MAKSIFNLINKALSDRANADVTEYAKINQLSIVETEGEDGKGVTLEQATEQFNTAQEMTYAAFTGRDFEGKPLDVRSGLSLKETLITSDVSILFPRVISTILEEAQEPELFLTNNVAETIPLAIDDPLTIEFTQAVGMIATEMSENQEYMPQDMAWNQATVSIRMKKIGVGASLSSDVIARSQWPLVTMYLRNMASAIRRKIESILSVGLKQRSHSMFDNESSDSTYRTSGVGATNAWNASFAYKDLVTMCAKLLANKYQATHFLAHPLSWPIWAQDPILRAQFFHGGQLGAGIWNRAPQWDQQAMIPFGITYVPYYDVDFTEAYTLTGAGSSLGASLVSDAYLIDKKNALYLATKGGLEMDQKEDWFKDGLAMKARQYAGMSVKDHGQGIMKATKIRIVENRQAIFRVETVAL